MTSLPHRIEIETAWAMRSVMEAEMNRERLETFEARKDALRCVAFSNPNIAAPCITKQAQEENTIRRLRFPLRAVRPRHPISWMA